jgi:hypothetical protein
MVWFTPILRYLCQGSETFQKNRTVSKNSFLKGFGGKCRRFFKKTERFVKNSYTRVFGGKSPSFHSKQGDSL